MVCPFARVRLGRELYEAGDGLCVVTTLTQQLQISQRAAITADMVDLSSMCVADSAEPLVSLDH
jgi:hypothetical protein